MNAESLTPAVVDASVVIKWLIEEPGSIPARAQRHTWQAQRMVPAAPDFLLIELHSILLKKVTRGEITPDMPLLSDTPAFGLDLSWFPFKPLLPTAWQTAHRYQISIYDALYVTLAQQVKAPLYTADRTLVQRLGPKPSIQLLLLT